MTIRGLGGAGAVPGQSVDALPGDALLHSLAEAVARHGAERRSGEGLRWSFHGRDEGLLIDLRLCLESWLDLVSRPEYSGLSFRLSVEAPGTGSAPCDDRPGTAGLSIVGFDAALLASWFECCPAEAGGIRILRRNHATALFSPFVVRQQDATRIAQAAGRIQNQADGTSFALHASRGQSLWLLQKAFEQAFPGSTIETPILSPASPRRNRMAPLTELLSALLGESEDTAAVRDIDPTLAFLRRYPYRNAFCHDIEIYLRRALVAAFGIYARRCWLHTIVPWVIIEHPAGIDQRCLALVEQASAEHDRGVGSQERIHFARAVLDTRTEVQPEAIHASLSSSEIVRLVRMAMPTGGPDIIASTRAALQDPVRLALIIETTRSERNCEATPRDSSAILASRVFTQLPHQHLRLLVLHGLCEDVMARRDFLQSAVGAGFTAQEIERIEGFWRSLGILIGHPDSPKLIDSDLAHLARSILANSGSDPLPAFMEILALRVEARTLAPCLHLFRSMMRAASEGGRQEGAVAGTAQGIQHALFPGSTVSGARSAIVSAKASSCRRLCASPGCFALAAMANEQALDPGSPSAWTLEDSPRAAWPEFLSAYEHGDPGSVHKAIESLEEAGLKQAADMISPSGGPDQISVLLHLARAFDTFASSDVRTVAPLAKAALLLAHDSGELRLQARAQRLMGLCSLVPGRLIQAVSYFSNAAELALGEGDWIECTRAMMAEAGVWLALGDFARVYLIAEDCRPLAHQAMRSLPEEVSHFLKGRTDFELGRYDQATDAFSGMRTLALEFGHAEIALRAGAWQARSLAYSGTAEGIAQAEALLDTQRDDPEALFFAAETLFISGNLEAACETAREAARKSGLGEGQLDSPGLPEGYRSADRQVWSDGYSAFDGLILGVGADRSLASERILAFHLFTRGLVHRGQAAHSVEALLGFVREKRIAEIHPYAYLYYYYAYVIARDTGCPGPSPLSLVSRAFKALQLRAGRLHGEEYFEAFFGANRDSAAIMEAARRSRLL